MSTIITEADVMAFIKDKSDKIALAFPGLSEVKLQAGPQDFTVSGYIKGTYDYKSGFGATIQEAAEDLHQNTGSLETIAAEKRERAARLLAEAEALSPSTQNETAPVL